MSVKYKLSLYTASVFDRTINAAIDSIETYLAAKSHDDFTELAPSVIGMTTRLVISLPEAISSTTPALSSKWYFYAKLTSIDGTTEKGRYYFFVDSFRRIANATAEVMLTLDTINTFWDTIKGGMTARTLTKREMRSRFSSYSSKTISGSSMTLSLNSVIDPINEGMNPLQYKKSEKAIEAKETPRLKWYLLYKTRADLTATNIANPLDCFAVSEEGVRIADEFDTGSGEWQLSDLAEGTYYYLTYESMGWDVTIEGDTSATTSPVFTSKTFHLAFEGDYLLQFHKVGLRIYVAVYALNTATGELTQTYVGTFASSVTYGAARIVFNCVRTLRTLTYETTNSEEIIANGTLMSLYIGKGNPEGTTPFREIDRTDAKILKIIELPYAPSKLTMAGDVFSLEGFKPYFNIFRLTDINMTFSDTLEDQASECLTIEKITGADWISMRLASSDFDPKMFSSEFMTDKFAYDNFSLPILWERLGNDKTLSLTFYPSTNLGSNSLFQITASGATSYMGNLDYPLSLVTNRNNEVPIFSNNFVDYIRNGYNYDKKSKAVESISRWTSLGLTLAGSAVTMAAAAANPALGVIGAGLVFSAANQLQSAITGQINRDDALKEKLQTLRNQTTNVSGSDDLSLFNIYSGDKLKRIKYGVSPEDEKRICSYFYYYGYATNIQKVPAMTGRIFFNYIQCDAVFSESSKTILGEYLSDILTKLSNGVTIFHEFSGVWDIDQTHENWESALIAQ